MVIAQIPTASADQLLTVLLGGAALAVIFNQGVAAWRNLSGKAQKRELDQPLEVSAAPEYARKDHVHLEYLLREDCQKRHADDERRMKDQTSEIKASLFELGKKLDAHNANAESRASKLHERIDPLSIRIGEVDRTVDNHLKDHRSGSLNHAG